MIHSKNVTDTYRKRFQNVGKALRYADRFERGTRKRIDHREQRAVRKIFSHLSELRNVLDVPCGAGRFLNNLSQNGREVIEMDVASDILELSRDRAERLGLKARFMVGDASRLPLAEGSVDAIFCNRLLHHIPDPTERAGFLREFRRVTRRYLIISFFDYLAFGKLRRCLKALKGRNVSYEGQPTLAQFLSEATACGFQTLAIVPTGAIWVAQKFLVLQIL